MAEGLKGLFLGPGERRTGNYWMGWMIRSEGTGEDLGAEELKMVLDRKVFGFGMEEYIDGINTSLIRFI